eukprot:UN12861
MKSDQNSIQNAEFCKISNLTINYNKMDINFSKIRYLGSNLKNGAIITVHGGGYCFLDAKINFELAELLSKLTGCIVFCLNYKLCPEYPLPYSMNQLINFYEYLLYDKQYQIPSHKIAMTGDSAGGGMILLTLQSIKYGSNKFKNLPQPCCVWLNSPWTNLAMNTSSYQKNIESEAMMDIPLLKNMSLWSIGNLDEHFNIIGNNNPCNAIYSPIYGKFIIYHQCILWLVQ